MQISRHWRMNANRYRLVGVRYENGDVSVQNRPVPILESFDQDGTDSQFNNVGSEVARSTAA